jgi:regulatory protein
MEDLLTAALRALGRKERTVAEMEVWLRRRDREGDEADAVLTHLVETGALDDERFARRFAEDKRELAGWGSERIREALIGRGIAADRADASLGDRSDANELRAALGALERRGAAIADRQQMGRALGWLARRGYPSEVAHEAVKIAARRATGAA